MIAIFLVILNFTADLAIRAPNQHHLDSSLALIDNNQMIQIMLIILDQLMKNHSEMQIINQLMQSIKS